MSKEQILGLIRHILTAVGGAVVMLGYFDETLVTEVTGGLMTAIGFVWSFIDKINYQIDQIEYSNHLFLFNEKKSYLHILIQDELSKLDIFSKNISDAHIVIRFRFVFEQEWKLKIHTLNFFHYNTILPGVLNIFNPR